MSIAMFDGLEASTDSSQARNFQKDLAQGFENVKYAREEKKYGAGVKLSNITFGGDNAAKYCPKGIMVHPHVLYRANRKNEESYYTDVKGNKHQLNPDEKHPLFDGKNAKAFCAQFGFECSTAKLDKESWLCMHNRVHGAVGRQGNTKVNFDALGHDTGKITPQVPTNICPFQQSTTMSNGKPGWISYAYGMNGKKFNNNTFDAKGCRPI